MRKVWDFIMFLVWTTVVLLLFFWSIVKMAEVHEENKSVPRHYQGKPIDPLFQ